MAWLQPTVTDYMRDAVARVATLEGEADNDQEMVEDMANMSLDEVLDTEHGRLVIVSSTPGSDIVCVVNKHTGVAGTAAATEAVAAGKQDSQGKAAEVEGLESRVLESKLRRIVSGLDTDP